MLFTECCGSIVACIQSDEPCIKTTKLCSPKITKWCSPLNRRPSEVRICSRILFCGHRGCSLWALFFYGMSWFYIVLAWMWVSVSPPPSPTAPFPLHFFITSMALAHKLVLKRSPWEWGCPFSLWEQNVFIYTLLLHMGTVCPIKLCLSCFFMARLCLFLTLANVVQLIIGNRFNDLH